MSVVPNWRDRVARAAAADVGWTRDKPTISQARRLVDQAAVGAKLGVGILAALGALFGLIAASSVFGSTDGTVNATWALFVIVACPWLSRILWRLFRMGVFVVMVLRHRAVRDRRPSHHASPLLGRIVLECMVRFAERYVERGATPDNLAGKTARRIRDMLVKSVGRWIAAAGSASFWTAYALAAMATIWFETMHVAHGFGWTWESSHVPLHVTRWVSEFTAAAVEFAGPAGSGGLTPVAPAPVVPADDPEALAVRHSWVYALIAGVVAYLMLPMMFWTVVCTVIASRKAKNWEPKVVFVPRAAAPVTRCRNEPASTLLRLPAADGGRCTHVVRIERPRAAVDLPAPLDQLVDLGDADATADLERVRGKLCDDKARVVVVGWLRVSPDRGVQDKLRTLASASTAAPLLVLDGGHAFRRSEPDGTLAIRREEWRTAASRTGVTPFECDLAELTDECRRDLARAVGYGEDREDGHQQATEPGSESTRR